MDCIEAEGSSIDDAIAQALARLGVARDRVELEIIAKPSRGLFGFGSRPARVRATLRPPHQSAKAAAVSDPQPDTLADFPRPAPAAARASVVLSDIIRLMGVDAAVEIGQDPEAVRLDIGGDPSGLLIGRRGQTLDALEYLVNRIVGHDEASPTRLIIDANGYRVRRRQALEQQARSLAERVRRGGKPISLTPLGPRERRIVHLALQGDSRVTTRSTGDGFHRKVLIVPAAPRRQRG
ncbi:MAG: RNA-binding cell elongation regulator Jag/EloR [bacterium]